MTKISVVIPCYNHGKYIDQAVDSILAQTFQDFEIIIVNDGSTDEFTMNKLRNYDRPKTTVVHQENSGLPAARNSGIEESEGKYICTLDSDDYFEKTFLEKAVDVLENNEEYGVVTSWIRCFGKINKVVKLKPFTLKKFLLQNNCCACVLFRKKIWEDLNGFDENMTDGYEDWDFWLRAIYNGYNFKLIEEELFFWRITKNGMHFDSARKRKQILKYMTEKNKIIYEDNLFDIINEHAVILDEILTSTDVRVGKFVLKPFKIVRSLYYKFFRRFF